VARPWSELDRNERRLLAVTAAVVAVTAWNSVTFFHPDEHYQILEFAGYKLGFTPREALPWEFDARIRAFFQPALCVAIIRGLQALGIEDRFVFAWVLRTFSGLVTVSALAMLCRVTLGWFGSPADPVRRAQARVLTLCGFWPYLAVRTAPETLSAALFTLGAALLLQGRDPEGAARPAEPMTFGALRAFIAGALLGLAFEARFQTVIMNGGLLAWLAFRSRISTKTLALLGLGVLGALGIGALCDRWGYGAFCFPPISYLRVNALQGVANRYGTEPFFGYLYMLPANVAGPVVVVLLVALILTWLRRPRHVVTWITLPFVLVHSALAHKEERFLFPILPIALLGVGLGIAAPPSGRAGPLRIMAERFAAFLWSRRRLVFARFVLLVNFGAMTLLAFYPLGWRPNEMFYGWADRGLPRQVHFVTEGAEEIYPDYPFLRRGTWTRTLLVPGQPLARDDTLYLVREDPFVAPDEARLGCAAELVYSEFPLFHLSWVRGLFPLLAAVRRFADAHHFPQRAKWITVYRLVAPALDESSPASKERPTARQ
jgi:phosphatidylinositol glycan class B